MEVNIKDYCGLWSNELSSWVPQKICDAHAHLTPPQFIQKFGQRKNPIPLTTFAGFSWKDLQISYSKLFPGKSICRIIAFPMPLREVDIQRANKYIFDLLKGNCVSGLILYNPNRIDKLQEFVNLYKEYGQKTIGIKPYHDIIRSESKEANLADYISDSVLEIMDKESGVIMLHAPRNGISEANNLSFVSGVLKNYERISIVLAHMGCIRTRNDFEAFLNSDVIYNKHVLFETSTNTLGEPYDFFFNDKIFWDRIMFGTDLPWGLITGYITELKGFGPRFITRDIYPWTGLEERNSYVDELSSLTHNVYHVISSMKRSMERVSISIEEQTLLKEKIMFENCQRVFG